METVDKESKEAKKPKEVKFAVETMELNETVKNKLKDARIAKIKNESEDAYNGLISANCRNCL